jgi:hypothetical protein
MRAGLCDLLLQEGEIKNGTFMYVLLTIRMHVQSEEATQKRAGGSKME